VGPALTLLTLLLALLLIVGAGGGALIPSAQRYESPLLGIFVKKKRKQKVLNTL
jgi:regulator of protease activity HflC (stomatin/prohibitin superfamily)